jgi:type VI secretion system secreted protein VgrG
MPLKQENRHLAIKTALGPNELAIRSVSIQEQLSRLFHIEAELCSEDGTIDFDSVVGREATIRLNVAQQGKRYFHGFVSRLAQLANQDGYARYQATIVPWLWFLTRTADCRIFQNKKVPDIIEEVFKGHGFNDYQLKLSSTYQEWEYCVQYRETDFNFVSRLMEQEGIYYFFEHEDGKHTLVMADSISAHKPFPNYADITFHEREEAGTPGREVVIDWTMEKQAQPVACALNDFDFKKPRASLRASSNLTRPYGKAEFEIYDYPGEYIEHDEGQRLSDVRLHELQTQYEVLHGQATARGVATGCTFNLKSHPRQDQNREYLIVGVSLQIDAGPFESAAGGDGEFFSCNFSAIDKAQQFRPARLTPRPIVQGPQTAIVVGPSGEEIYTDEHARVKVQFHWDRYGKSDENSSCWIRVAQIWAGKKWGALFTPRMGQEVVVEFLEGDPDHPLITGSVYNAEQKPPYDQPDEMTKSTIKSNSTKGGVGFNEIRFEDLKGKEQVFIHAQRNMDVRVNASEMESVGGDRNLTIGGEKDGQKSGDQKEMVYRNKHLKVHRHQFEQIGGDMVLTVGGVDDGTGDQYILIKGQKIEEMQDGSLLKVTGDFDEEVDGNRTTLVKNGSYNVSVDNGFLVSGGQEIHLVSPLKVVIESSSILTLKVGGNFVNITPLGVDIFGTLVNINSGGAPASGSPVVAAGVKVQPLPLPDSPADADDAKSGQKSARS